MTAWHGLWRAAGVAVVVLALAACSSSRAVTAKESTAKRVSDPSETATGGKTHNSFTTAAPLIAGPPLAGGQGGAPDSTSTVVTPAASTPSVSAATASAAAGSSAVAAPVRSTSPPPDVPTSCGAHDLRVSFDIQPAGGTQPLDRTRVLMVLTNLSGEACTMQGFATVDAVEAGQWKSLDLLHVAQPGQAGPVVLAGGGSAFAGMEWTDTAGCPEVSAFRLLLPGPAAVLPVDVAAPGGKGQTLVVCAADVELGPFASTSEGTVAFPDSVGAGT